MQPHSPFTGAVRASVLLAALVHVAPLAAQSTPPVRPSAQDTARRDSVKIITGMTVRAERDARPVLNRLTMPVTVGISAREARTTVNLIDVQDAVKYLPSVFLRKRNNGDTQATMATRVWGVSSSARSLVYADGVPLTALIANNNTLGGPRWGLVAPEDVDRVDMMYGPFSAAYGGNSMGAVMEITTRTPTRREGSLTQSQAWQRFDLYGTQQTYGTTQTSARLADRFGRLTASVSGNYQDSHSQPLSYVTGSALPSNTSGGFTARNKLDATANVLGASGLLHTQMTNGTLRLAYDLTPHLQLAYRLGLWQNDADAGVDTYLTRTGAPSYAGLTGFASGRYTLLQQHSAHSLALRSDTRRDWDVEVVGTRFRFDTDRQRVPTSASSTGVSFGQAGRVAVLTGTGWQTLDVKGAWHKGGPAARHTVTFGAHADQYRLVNPTYTTADWTTDAPYTGVATRGDGSTRTMALWAQDRWQLAPTLRLTAGGRWETWRAFDGVNVNGTTTVVQPERRLSRFSPKATLMWSASPEWSVTGSVGKAYRFATPAELYQLVSTGTTFTAPDATLKPDNVLASELRVERRFPQARVQVALFNDDVHDAILSQFKPLVPGSNTFYSYVSNVDHVRATGAEVVLAEQDLMVPGLSLSGSVTWLHARTLATSGRASATAAPDAAIGKQLPNIPEWRASFVATYKPVSRLSLSMAGRYSDAVYTTLDNADVNPNTWQGFSGWFVADAKANVELGQHVTASLGADNLFNRKYFLFHPFPQRTIVSALSVRF
jgi:iron complex outermembrane receptor protein